ncbi:MAG: MarR family winged helix-turn-helix transcriptional regulator [Actinomycetes bacterium]
MTAAPELRRQEQDDRCPTAGVTEQVQLLTRTMHVLRNQVAAAGGDDLPWSTYMLLFHLVSGGPRRASALAEVACIDPSTVSRQVSDLVRLGLVERRADPDDGRATVLVATERGVETQQRMRRGRDRMMARVLQSWSDKDVDQLTGALRRFNADLTAELPGIVASLQRRTASGLTLSSADTLDDED